MADLVGVYAAIHGPLIVRAWEQLPADCRQRVAVLATGGMSHSIGEVTMGAIDEAFDRECLQHLASGKRDTLMASLDQRTAAAGNGTAEMRNWLAAHGVAGGQGFELIHYSAMPEIYVGCGVASWRI